MISIITPIYDVESHLPVFTETISKLINSPKEKIVEEVILINNNPKIDLMRVKNVDINLPKLRVVQNRKNRGYGAACNQGIRQARGEHILILNPDVNVSLKTLNGLINALKKNDGANIVSCRLMNENGSLQHSCRRFPTLRALLARRMRFPFRYIFKKELGRYNMEDYDHESPRKVDWVSGALMLMKKRHYFDEHYFMYFEDVDLCRRVGGVYYYPNFSAIHKAERQSAKNIMLFFSHFKSMIYYFYKGYRKNF